MDFTITTHNAYWFRGSPSRQGEGLPRLREEILDALIRLYVELNPDVLCLQEIPSREVFEVLRERLEMVGDYAPGGMRTAYGGAILTRCPGFQFADHSQAEVGGGRTFERVHLRARVEVEGRVLEVANLHLSSDRFAPNRNGEPIRLAELEAALHTPDRPDIVVGDFNALPTSTVCQRMQQYEYYDAGLDSDVRDHRGEDRIDYVWLNHNLRDRLLSYEVTSGSAFLYDESPTMLSDHCPVTVRVETAISN